MYNWKETNTPSYMHDGLERYVLDGIRPGEFLYAVLTNNFREAVCKVDGVNVNHLRDWALLPYWEMRDDQYGSVETVEAWIKKGGLRAENHTSVPSREDCPCEHCRTQRYYEENGNE